MVHPLSKFTQFNRFETAIPFFVGNKSHWFELKSYHLSCYNDKTCIENKFTLPLGGFELNDKDSGLIKLVNPLGMQIKELWLSCDDENDFDDWKLSFARVFDEKEYVYFDEFVFILLNSLCKL